MRDNEIVAIGRPHRDTVIAWLHLARVYARVEQTLYSLLSQHGLTPAQFDVLSHLASEPDLSQQALADRLLVTKGNVCGLIDRLERDGLAARHTDPDDRRRHRLCLTDRGRRAFEEAAPELEATIERGLSGLSGEERRTLMHLLGRLDRSLQS